MTGHTWIVTLLLHAYPSAWRREYGAELADVLAQRPLTTATVVDLLRSAIILRVQYAAPAFWMGTVTALFVTAGIVRNLAFPQLGGIGFSAVLEDSSKTLPTVIVAPLATDFYVLALVACGCWTRLRYRRGGSASGNAAVALGAIAGIPVMILGTLMLMGVIHLRAVDADGVITSLADDRWAYTYYTVKSHVPSPLAILTAPLFRLPESWLWGITGGGLGRLLAARWHVRPAQS